MPPQNQNSEERKGAGAKRKLEAMDTNDGASSKQAAEDVRPQVRLPSSDGKKRKREREKREEEEERIWKRFSSPSVRFARSAAFLLSLSFSATAPSHVLVSAGRGRQRRRRGASVVRNGDESGRGGPVFRTRASSSSLSFPV